MMAGRLTADDSARRRLKRIPRVDAPSTPAGSIMSLELIHTIIAVAFLTVLAMAGEIQVRRRRVRRELTTPYSAGACTRIR